MNAKKLKARFSVLSKLSFRHAKKKASVQTEDSRAKAAKEKEGIGFAESVNEIFREFKEEKLRKERFAVMGVGNDLKGDDGVGFYVVDRLRKKLGSDDFFMLIKTAMPEDHVREIKEFAPTLLIIVDAADFGKGTGSMKVINDYEISEAFISTHTTPLTIFLRLYNADQPVKSPVTMIGIQRRSNEFGQQMCGQVRKAGDAVVDIISGLYEKKLLGTMLESEIERRSSVMKRIGSRLKKK
jgi:hydrogenase 3 maturation protease